MVAVLGDKNGSHELYCTEQLIFPISLRAGWPVSCWRVAMQRSAKWFFVYFPLKCIRGCPVDREVRCRG